MPYTFLHPGFILPFARWLPRFFNVPALIIGSFVPDLDIIYRFSETRYHIFSFSTANILLELLPIGIIMTYYFYMIILPILKDGTIDIYPKNYLQHLKSLPLIIINVLIAILLHLFLDQYAHFNDVKNLSIKIGNDLGYESYEFQKIYFLLLYLPQLLISGLGFILTCISAYLYRKEIRINIEFLLKNRFLTLVISGIVISSFTAMKIIKSGVEHGMQIDSILIGITCGLMSAFLLTPLLLWMAKK